MFAEGVWRKKGSAQKLETIRWWNRSARGLRSKPSIAPRPARARAVTDLLRLVPYLMPYRVRWIAMVGVAVASLFATIAIPLMTRAVIDGPVHRRDPHGLWILGSAAVAVGVAEAALWFIRRWLVARATMGVESDIRKDLYARLQILPMSFHGRWESGQLLSRMMNDLGTIRRLLSFGLIFLMLNVLQIVVVTVILLVMYWPLGVVVGISVIPVTVTMLRFERRFTTLSRRAQDQAGNVATAVESLRWDFGWSSPSGGRTTSTNGSTAGRPCFTTRQSGRCRSPPGSGLCSRSSPTSP